MLFALVSTSNQPPDSLAVNGELLMNLPTVLGVWCALAASRHAGMRRVLLNVIAGAMCGVAALYKYQAALVGLSFLFLIRGEDARDPKRLAVQLLTRGAALATGEWLLFTDADVVFAEDALARALAWLERDRKSVV